MSLCLCASWSLISTVLSYKHIYISGLVKCFLPSAMSHISVVDPSQEYSSIINKLILTKNLRFGGVLHSHLIKTAFIFNTFLSNRIIQIYSTCHSIDSSRRAFDDMPIKNQHSWNTLVSSYCQAGQPTRALKLFDEMPEPNSVTYNSLVSGLSRNGLYHEAIRIMRRMRKECDFLVVDWFTIVGVIGACASLGALGWLRQVHAVAVMMGMEGNGIICNALVDGYGKCGLPDIACDVFKRICDKDIVSWTSMVTAYMCAGRIEDACCVFSQMPDKSTISWTSLIAGLVQNGSSIEALDTFTQMTEEAVMPNSFTFVSALSACADAALIEPGKQIHGHLVKRFGRSDLYNAFVSNALIDMYCKCSCMKAARNLFNGRWCEKDTVTWNSMINGCAQNGYAMESLSFFKRMIQERVVPNHVTFLGVLVACGHTGLVSEGFHFLEIMETDHGLRPKSEHYAVLVDMLGRRNKLYEAMELIEKVPVRSDRIRMWGSLLSSCRLHGNMNLAMTAAEALHQLEPENPGRYVTLSQTYAAADRWDDSCRIWKIVEHNGLMKETGYSWIEVKNERHQFKAMGVLHPEMEDIYGMVHSIVDQMKDAGIIACILTDF